MKSVFSMHSNQALYTRQYRRLLIFLNFIQGCNQKLVYGTGGKKNWPKHLKIPKISPYFPFSPCFPLLFFLLPSFLRGALPQNVLVGALPPPHKYASEFNFYEISVLEMVDLPVFSSFCGFSPSELLVE